jgi:hypothetical protein
LRVLLGVESSSSSSSSFRVLGARRLVDSAALDDGGGGGGADVVGRSMSVVCGGLGLVVPVVVAGSLEAVSEVLENDGSTKFSGACGVSPACRDTYSTPPTVSAIAVSAATLAPSSLTVD